ncbi:MAG: 3-methyl-2-oxobutanoate hydroxymethyltransferase [Desulfarculaceae bacterium]|nr:3-methyl-2-oxobutanoate hydroxymethyltransferase [Desulfarculaceae bacterium]MCF8073985.1 3-methyl-2-oxobutanoate hydroxymethyltransferase [Desulfarculaceae bacterium]MCF8102671.1 3-methyl-2-oxobutanoate hydroxymethyltransferase [Desulfarculaceae bacterium]MCF8116088.1 3-methyl-2-oxobutanoate hydroxymethyltransferase [Desulfarculaceae bacterium]
MDRKKITIPDLIAKKKNGQKVTMLTAYDYPTARAMDRAGVDSVLVGDSLGNVVLGYESTVPVTMDEMLHHVKAVRRGLTYPLLIGDMPFMSYQVSLEQAVMNAGRFLKEGGCDCVKLEGGTEMAPTVKAIVDAGIPVCAHIGLTPQSVAQLGGYKVQGKDLAGAQKLIDDAGALAEAGASLIVFECIPSPLAAAITANTPMVTIGIGAGPDCDGQVLVVHDLIGLAERTPPKMAKQYVNLFPQLEQAISSYVEEVGSEAFPAEEHGFAMDQAVVDQLKL